MAAYDTKRRHMSGHVSPPGLSTAGNDAGQDAPGPPAGFILPISGNISLLLTERKTTGSNGHKDRTSRPIRIHECLSVFKNESANIQGTGIIAFL